MNDYVPKLPDRRWEPDYATTEFVPQQVPAIEKLIGRCTTIDTELESARRLLARMTIPQWRGKAGDVFREYVGEVTGFVRTMRGVSTDTKTALETARTAVTTATQDATAAVTAINQVLQEYAALDDDDTGGLTGLGDKIADAGSTLVLSVRRDHHYARATQAHDDAVAALTTLAGALDQPDATIAALSVPTPPGGISLWLRGLSPEERRVLGALFDDVGDALDETGQTPAARTLADRARTTAAGDDDDEKAQVLRDIAAMSPEEQAWVLNHLDEDDVAALLAGLDPHDDRDVYNDLARSLPLELQRRLADTDPNHYWHPYTGQSGRYGWGVPVGPGRVPTGDPATLQQGGLGDCHVLASLAAMEQADPGFLQRHVVANPNGTFTVTLYKDGEPIEVVVNSEVPFTVNGDGTLGTGAYTHGGENQDQAWTNDQTLYMIYEKALAQAWGEVNPDGQDENGYAGMNGGWPYDDMPMISGIEMDQHEPPSDVSFEDFQDARNDGRPVTVTTKFDPDPAANPLYADDHSNQAVGGHEYYVTDVQGEPPNATVTLANPWGSDLPGTGTITVTWDELQDQFHSVQVGT